MRGVGNRGVWAVAALLALGFWQLGQGAYIPAKAWFAQELMQRAWLRASAGEDRAAPWPWADTWPVARLLLPEHGVDVLATRMSAEQAVDLVCRHLVLVPALLGQEPPDLATSAMLHLGTLLAVLVYLLAPGGLAHPAKVTAATAVLMGVWWMTEAIPIPATSLVPRGA